MINEIALAKLGLAAQRCVFIDDRIELINAAKGIGLNGIVFRDLEQVKGELVRLDVSI